MTLVKRTHYPFTSMFDDFLKNDMEPFKGFNPIRRNVPAINVEEGKDGFHLDVMAPGYIKDDFTLKVEDDILTIASKVEENHEEKDEKRMIRKEFSKTSFSRSFSLPETVSHEEIAAEYKNGVLKVSIPKKEIEAKPNRREISIA